MAERRDTAKKLANRGVSGPGAVETAVRQDIDALMTTHPMGEAIAEMSYALARMLDQGAGLATAAVNKELRANLAELAKMKVADNDDLDDALSSPSGPLPSSLRD